MKKAIVLAVALVGCAQAPGGGPCNRGDAGTADPCGPGSGCVYFVDRCAPLCESDEDCDGAFPGAGTDANAACLASAACTAGEPHCICEPTVAGELCGAGCPADAVCIRDRCRSGPIACGARACILRCNDDSDCPGGSCVDAVCR
jgi:hypothetical protein